MDRKVKCLSDGGVGCFIEESELKWDYRVSGKCMIIDKGCIYKTLGGFKVY